MKLRNEALRQNSKRQNYTSHIIVIEKKNTYPMTHVVMIFGTNEKRKLKTSNVLKPFIRKQSRFKKKKRNLH